MADQFNVPTESWRPRRRESMIGPQVRRMALLAAAVVAVVGLGYAGYAMFGHGQRAVPVIEADQRPLRVRPDNPGGMQVVGADELVGPGGTEAMAPPPEAPAPQALRAKIKAELLAASLPPAPVTPAPVVPAPQLVTVTPPEPPASIAPEPRAAIAKPPVAAKAPPAAPSPAASSSGTQVQLGALESEQAAHTEWLRLSHRMPELLAARQPAVLHAERDGHAIYRLRTGGFADPAAATAFCAQVRSKGVGCSIATF